MTLGADRGAESAVTATSRTRSCSAYARDLHLVLGLGLTAPIRFRVTIEGHEPGADHGADTDAHGSGSAASSVSTSSSSPAPSRTAPSASSSSIRACAYSLLPSVIRVDSPHGESKRRPAPPSAARDRAALRLTRCCLRRRCGDRSRAAATLLAPKRSATVTIDTFGCREKPGQGRTPLVVKTADEWRSYRRPGLSRDTRRARSSRPGIRQESRRGPLSLHLQ